MPKPKTNQDGGYYAIKGFTYQFDKSILEVLANKTELVEIEYIQDISVNGYYIQVKHKESQTYSNSKIRKAVLQLLNDFLTDRTKKFILYCYFKDKSTQKVVLTKSNLDSILGSEKDAYTSVDKQSFIEHFHIEFSQDFEKQFSVLIGEIKTCFNLKNNDEVATLYHSIFRANIINIAIKKKANERVLDFNSLKELIEKKEKIIFEFAHCKYLKNEKYISYLKNEYFTSRLNTSNKERLFLIEIDETVLTNEIVEIISNIKNRYYKKQISPAPYVCLINIDKDKYNEIKKIFWDKKLFFKDGTNFNGDKFRILDLIKDTHQNNSNESFKVIFEENISELLKYKDIDETVLFLTSDEVDWSAKFKQFKKFYINKTKDIIKIIT